MIFAGYFLFSCHVFPSMPITDHQFYSGISITRTHYKADSSIRRTVWRGTDCFALRSNYLRKNLYKADISIKETLFLHQCCPLYRDFTVFSITWEVWACLTFSIKWNEFSICWKCFLLLNYRTFWFQEIDFS